MTLKFQQACVHAMLDAMETDIGASPIMYLRSGAPPTNVTDADTGTLISTLAMAADAFSAAASWQKAITAALQDTSADNAGTLGHFRIKTSGAVVKIQGTITATGGGGDMEADNTSVTAGQEVNVTAFAVAWPTANRGS